MPFKKTQPSVPVPDSPDLLLPTFSRRRIPDVLPHQQQLLRAYSDLKWDTADVAFQLPTGSGKTLVGLLMGEWVRRKYHEKVVYLCPTRQLVHQVVTLSREKYGLTVLGFTGSKHDYPPEDKAAYREGAHIAVTTYSSVFNSSPFFDEANVLIVDDAHASESYIAAPWSIQVEKNQEKHQNLHAALCRILKPHLSTTLYSRLTGQWSATNDYDWSEILPAPLFSRLREDFIEVLDTYTTEAGLNFAWTYIRDHLAACHCYFSPEEILIRPLIPPTWTHAAFTTPRQRIYMSATLGNGGDLERIMGRPNIKRIPIPDGWERQGVGRRLFLFPGMSLPLDQTTALQNQMMQDAGRSIVLVPSDAKADHLRDQVQELLTTSVLTARALEKSKTPFTDHAHAVAVIANRYDGLDFPGDECRLEFIAGLPQATNAQERFLMTKMGANVLYHERIRTRILQAMGRCTRSMEDFAAIVVMDEQSLNYLLDPGRRRFFHPELQAELQFGIDQSRDTTAAEFMEYLKTFLANGEEWEEDGNQAILGLRTQMNQEDLTVLTGLEQSVADEIKYEKALWGKNYVEALDRAERVIGKLTDPALRGYRALWHYLAGNAAKVANLEEKIHRHYKAVREAASGLQWLTDQGLSASPSATSSVQEDPAFTICEQVANIEQLLERLGTTHDRRFAEQEKRIWDGLATAERFEEAHKLLGQMLGFRADKVESDGSPDPWWLVGNLCLVFEDHAGAQPNSVLGADKARQVKGHPDWMRANIPETQSATILSVLVSPVSTVMPGAVPHLQTVSYWALEDFRQWAQNAMSTIRVMRQTYTEPGDLQWRENAMIILKAHQLDAQTLFDNLQSRSALNFLTIDSQR